MFLVSRNRHVNNFVVQRPPKEDKVRQIPKAKPSKADRGAETDGFGHRTPPSGAGYLPTVSNTLPMNSETRRRNV